MTPIQEVKFETNIEQSEMELETFNKVLKNRFVRLLYLPIPLRQSLEGEGFFGNRLRFGIKNL